jgi:hypothetical protein
MKEVWALWLADQIREKASVWLSLKDAEKLRRGVRSLELNSDRQATAILRIEEVCQRNGLEFFRPVNDRECALYISKADMGMNETNYSRFIPCYAS